VAWVRKLIAGREVSDDDQNHVKTAATRRPHAEPGRLPTRLVTAMMALFIVLWLMNASKQPGGNRRYFRDPTGIEDGSTHCKLR